MRLIDAVKRKAKERGPHLTHLDYKVSIEGGLICEAVQQELDAARRELDRLRQDLSALRSLVLSRVPETNGESFRPQDAQW